MGAAFLAALKAIPMIVGVIKELSQTLRSIQNEQTNKETEDMKVRLNALEHKVKYETDREELLKLVRAINNN